MSAINHALSKLAEQKAKPAGDASSIQRADIAPVKQQKPWLWLIAGFGLSLGVGSWAVSQSNVTSPIVTSTALDPIEVSAVVEPVANHSVANKPSIEKPVTAKSVTTKSVTAKQATEPKAESIKLAQVKSVAAAVPAAQSVTSQPVKPTASKLPTAPKPPTASKPTSPQSTPAIGEQTMQIEQVELTPQQLAQRALKRAQEALNDQDMDEAIIRYREALSYSPDNEETRQKLAVLYYGKGDERRAYELLQAGIKRNYDSETLRLSLSKLLIRSGQDESALNPLQHLPRHASREYLEMRAALSQKAKRTPMALESYQQLVKLESENARWWLGLAIQQERSLDLPSATHSYQQALTRVGISSQSQTFIRDRLGVLAQLEEGSDAD
ncbi:hypothetical protein BCU68_07290 [Vibrio sp. 10N.286.49.B3]|uniref:tetratricopeptide repeat protein n=1 Tax=Vibrio sp. 10N.286.49.B3 TaxID=1880855 RepID=UPI000C8188FF|nr:tetratricopeptide repeat protein [Vibrio sp. 10N.286.49.B3]PMH39892.1 hypothetical protein BCU68_07290 [Vibrio sp. 10N.286.49.B3]